MPISDEEARRIVEQEQQKIEGHYAHGGPTRPDDQGMMAAVLRVDNEGLIHLTFPKLINFLVMTPDQAGILGLRILQHARKAGFKFP